MEKLKYGEDKMQIVKLNAMNKGEELLNELMEEKEVSEKVKIFKSYN